MATLSIGSLTSWSSSTNLTTLTVGGKSDDDWSVWTSLSARQVKSGGTGKISNYSYYHNAESGSDDAYDGGGSAGTQLSWTDGSPTGSGDATGGDVGIRQNTYNAGDSRGFSITISDVDTTEQTLRLFVGRYSANSTANLYSITASISDGSTGDQTLNFAGSGGVDTDSYVDITFAAGSNDQTVTITYKANEAGSDQARVVNLRGAWLSTKSSSGATLSTSHTMDAFGGSADVDTIVQATTSHTMAAFGGSADVDVIAKASSTHTMDDFGGSATVTVGDTASLNTSHTMDDFGQSASVDVFIGLSSSHTMDGFGGSADVDVTVGLSITHAMDDFGGTSTIVTVGELSLSTSHVMDDFGGSAELDNLNYNGRLSGAIKEAYASAPTGVIVIHTLEFRHPNFVDESGNAAPIRVVLGEEALTAKLEADAPQHASQYVTFIAMNFDLQLPNVEHLAVPEIQISIDNVSREIEDSLSLAAASPYPVEVTYRPYLNTDLTEPQMNPPLTMTLVSAEADDFRVTAVATYGNASNLLTPREVYNVDRFPGIQR